VPNPERLTAPDGATPPSDPQSVAVPNRWGVVAPMGAGRSRRGGGGGHRHGSVPPGALLVVEEARPSDGTGLPGRSLYEGLTPSWGDAVLKLAAPMVLALLPTRAAWLRFVRHRDPWVGWLGPELNGWKTAVYSVLDAGFVAWFIATRGVGTDPASQCTRGWFRQVLTHPVGDECAAVSYAPWLLGTFDLLLWSSGC
jgi:hypothetical protein